MELEHIHSFVDVKPFVDILIQGADDGGDKTNGSSGPNTNITCGWSDSNQSSNSSFAGSYYAELSFMLEKVY